MSKQNDNSIKSAQMEEYPEPMSNPSAPIDYAEEAKRWLENEALRETGGRAYSLIRLLERVSGEAKRALCTCTEPACDGPNPDCPIDGRSVAETRLVTLEEAAQIVEAQGTKPIIGRARAIILAAAIREAK